MESPTFFEHTESNSGTNSIQMLLQNMWWKNGSLSIPTHEAKPTKELTISNSKIKTKVAIAQVTNKEELNVIVQRISSRSTTSQ